MLTTRGGVWEHTDCGGIGELLHPNQEAAMQISIAIIGALFVLFFAVVLTLRAKSPSAISRHPYRNPYGDTRGAWNEL
jgi:hypothetical protein